MAANTAQTKAMTTTTTLPEIKTWDAAEGNVAAQVEEELVHEAGRLATAGVEIIVVEVVVEEVEAEAAAVAEMVAGGSSQMAMK